MIEGCKASQAFRAVHNKAVLTSGVKLSLIILSNLNSLAM